MRATDLTTDDWQDGRDLGIEIEKPSAGDIEAAIRALDGRSRTLVTIGLAPASYIAIGGGSAGNYVVSVTDSENNVFDLVATGSDTEADETVDLISGGQAVTYLRTECVDLESALRAAMTFAEKGELDRTLTWRRQ